MTHRGHTVLQIVSTGGEHALKKSGPSVEMRRVRAEYEYTVVVLTEHSLGLREREREQTELLNRVASHGWRLVAVDKGKAFFERKTQEPADD